jgi:hypothetical protein
VTTRQAILISAAIILGKNSPDARATPDQVKNAVLDAIDLARDVNATAHSDPDPFINERSVYEDRRVKGT